MPTPLRCLRIPECAASLEGTTPMRCWDTRSLNPQMLRPGSLPFASMGFSSPEFIEPGDEIPERIPPLLENGSLMSCVMRCVNTSPHCTLPDLRQPSRLTGCIFHGCRKRLFTGDHGKVYAYLSPSVAFLNCVVDSGLLFGCHSNPRLRRYSAIKLSILTVHIADSPHEAHVHK